MFSMIAIVLLLLAFGILVGTFVWIAHLLVERAEEKKKAARKSKEREAEEEEEEVVEDEAGEEEEDGEDEVEDEVEEEKPEMVRGRGVGANYGLLLGALSCGLFWMSPLIMALSFVGIFYSGRAIVNGVRHFRIVIWRAVGGLLLNIGGIVRQFLSLLGIIPPLV